MRATAVDRAPRSAVHRPRLGLKFLGGGARGWGFELRFQADTGDQVREVSAYVSRNRSGDPAPEFPHVRSDSGESLGSEALDDAVRERAGTSLAYIETAHAWGRWKASR